ncbi:MAG: hypothetical protein HYY14_02040 [Candidatus Omnitrophica bacterium]|nr:hypothetical protein [Candidatus Omnitrophota bacterium]
MKGSFRRAVLGVLIVAIALCCGASPAAADMSDSIAVEVTIQQGVSEISLKDRDLNPIGELPQVNVTPSSARHRFGFGEVRVNYFAAGAFDLIAFTDDGGTSQTLGIQGVGDSGRRLLLKTWAAPFGIPIHPSESPMIDPLGPVTAQATVPDPQIDSLWGSVDPDGPEGPLEPGDDPDGLPDGRGGGERLGGVWKLIAEKDSTDVDGDPFLTVLSSSDPSVLDPNEMQIAPNNFQVYFAFDALGTPAQTYRGELIFEIRNK